MRELFRALSELESRLMQSHGVSLNEAMVLCAIGKERVAASTIVERTGLTPSHASKVIRAVEERNLLVPEGNTRAGDRYTGTVATLVCFLCGGSV